MRPPVISLPARGSLPLLVAHRNDVVDTDHVVRQRVLGGLRSLDRPLLGASVIVGEDAMVDRVREQVGDRGG